MPQLQEAMLKRIPVMPRYYPALTVSQRVRGRRREARWRREEFLSQAKESLAHPMGRMKPAVIEEVRISKPDATYRNVFLYKTSKKVNIVGRFRSKLHGPHTMRVEETVEGDTTVWRVVFPSYDSHFDAVKEYMVDEAREVDTSFLIMWRLRGDTASRIIPTGFLRDTPKLVAEYPVDGADNVDLGTTTPFSVKNSIYPSERPDGFDMDNIRVSRSAGFYVFEGDGYMNPYEDSKLNFSWRFRNRTGKDVRLRHWGLPMSVLYDDYRHVSQINVDIGFRDRTVPPGSSTTYGFTINNPYWTYGMVNVAHALEFYQDGMLRYAGGPMYQFRSLRLELP